MNSTDKQDRSILQRIAQKVMLEKGLLPEFSGDALAELDKIITPATIDDEKFRDLRIHVTWISSRLPK
jgi:exoribonuclease-2